ncbi:hypothetical protein Kpol_1010p19 [Vanderwaltozyma polyspora DSM 70294]|uniref:PUM-HD domain-containing protein n=1 Tax=Vanderwaltozyma polyspora (strain ATCC 22028 / DSM 70294 / BCRC 21397 / CBS 2163 / NBRC 10782 / NRRL Y-8283 / UCD 57-17) TaxID=436907 RepID=A7TIG6_VANPO|nr:uncharacterized protein Kpol_1010p19 [Vanderwaltozyma polyspora DSM 70294]EDO17904.1 hypothetical protein Kpol_1010p19 [Vanderwaltozyma polyspora DSM 70294]
MGITEKKSQSSLNRFHDLIDQTTSNDSEDSKFDEPTSTTPISSTTTTIQDQPQKLGSYRARAGRISNTLSNLLPSISARLHSKKSNTEKYEDSTNSNEITNNDVTTPTLKDADLKTKQIVPVVEGIPIDFRDGINASPDIENLIQFPDARSLLIQQNPRASSDSYSFNGILPLGSHRPRNDTVASQMTSLSLGTVGGSSSAIWSTNINPSDHLQNSSQQQYSANNLAPATTIYSSNPTFSNGPINNISNLGMHPSSWTGVNGNRGRSQSNASSIYTDAPTYEQLQRQNANNYLNGNNQGYDVPLVADDIDSSSINWVSMDFSVSPINQISNLLPTNTVSISNVFPLQQQHAHLSNAINLTSTSLVTLCSKFGKVISARTLQGINIALVEFESIDAAVHAMETLQGKEISMIGAPSTIAFAKIIPSFSQQPISFHPTVNVSDGQSQGHPLLHEQLLNGSLIIQQQGNISVPLFNPQVQSANGQQQAQQIQQSQSQQQQLLNHGSLHSTQSEKESCPFELPPPYSKNQAELLKEIISSFDTEREDAEINYIVRNSIKNTGTANTSNFGPLPDDNSGKEFDTPKLRELRKSIDANQINDLEIEQLAMAMLDELPSLSSDYLGNTIVQKLFEHSSDIIKDIMLRKTAKYLTSMGVHKNGTWACQKMITKADTNRQKMLIDRGVEKYCTPLFNDQFGNYVIQCVLKFGFPWNNFIFENIVNNFWIIAQNRYGSRAVRACLEAHEIVTHEQTIVLSAIIILFAEYLTTNCNGTLLVTWFLDTCTLPDRHRILTEKLVPDIVELCCHRLASLTILKILSFRGDDAPRNLILDAIFGNSDDSEPSENIKKILCDHTTGPTFVYKVLSMPLLEGDIRTIVIMKVKKVLTESNPAQVHRRLLEEVGLTPVNQNSPTSQSRHSAHVTNGFPQEAGRHVSHLSVSSARSNGSWYNNSSPQGSNSSVVNTTPSKTQLPVNLNGMSLVTSGIANGKNNSNYYMSGGIFPNNTNGSNIHPVTGGPDEIASQFESMFINNEGQPIPHQFNMANGNMNMKQISGTHHKDKELNLNYRAVFEEY